MAEELIRIDNLTFYYPESGNPALDSIKLAVNQGEFVGITGPTGAGKSTLSYCFNGIIPHYQAGRVAGKVYLGGVALEELPVPQLAAQVGSVFQDPESQIVSMSVEEEIAFGMENLHFSRSQMEERISEALALAGITDLRQRSTASLSGGQKQRVVIAAVLAMRPRLLILDEPTSELDPIGTEEVFKTLFELNKQHGITVVLFEQKIDQLAEFLDRLVVLHRGRILADGKPATVLAKQEVFDLGIKLPQISEFALLWDKNLRQVPITLQEGLAFVASLNGRGKF